MNPDYKILKGHEVGQKVFQWYVKNTNNGNLYGFNTRKDAEIFKNKKRYL